MRQLMLIDIYWRHVDVRQHNIISFKYIHSSFFVMVDVSWRQLTLRVSYDVFWRLWRIQMFFYVFWGFLKFQKIFAENWRKRNLMTSSIDINWRQLISIFVSQSHFFHFRQDDFFNDFWSFSTFFDAIR